MAIRILITDDHGVLRAGLRTLLNADPNMEVVGEAADGESALRLAQELKPDVVLMDLSMPGLSGIETTCQLKALLPEVRVLILTVHEDKELLQEAIRVGASGYISKRAAEADLLNAIFAVWRGIIYVQPQLIRSLISIDQPKSCDEFPEAEALTPREVEVLRLIVQGHTNRQIAVVLNLSSRTVESHRANLMGKLNLHSRVEVVRYAAEHGLLESSERN